MRGLSLVYNPDRKSMRGLSLVYNCPHTLSKFPTENSIFHLIK